MRKFSGNSHQRRVARRAFMRKYRLREWPTINTVLRDAEIDPNLYNECDLTEEQIIEKTRAARKFRIFVFVGGVLALAGLSALAGWLAHVLR